MEASCDGSAGALDREQHLVEQVEDGGVEILFVGLLLSFQVVALRVALGDAAVGLLRGVELAGGLFDAAHGGLVAGEDTEVVLLAQALEELLHLLGRNLGIRTDDEQDAPSAHAVGDVFEPGQGQHVVVGGLAGRLEHRREAVADEVVHLILRRVVRQALQELGEVLLAIEVVAALRGVVQIPGGLSPAPRRRPGTPTARAAATRGTRPFPRA